MRELYYIICGHDSVMPTMIESWASKQAQPIVITPLCLHIGYRVSSTSAEGFDVDVGYASNPPPPTRFLFILQDPTQYTVMVPIE